MTSEQRINDDQWARSKIGQRIATRVDFSEEVPRYTTGTVVSAGGLDTVAVQWDIPANQRPLLDWFTRDEYERFLSERIGQI